MASMLEKASKLRSSLRESDCPDSLASIIGDDRALLEMETPFGSWLHVAASFGRLGAVRWLLGQGLPVDRRGGTYDGSALNLAASGGHLDVVRCLLDHGASMDVSEPERNPLFAAILDEHCDVIEELLDRGIDARVSYTGKAMKDMDAIAFARENGRLEAMRVLQRRLGKTD